MKLPYSGNFYKNTELYRNTKGWFIGWFAKENLFKTNEFEVKWGVHKKGEMKKGIRTKNSTKTLVILLKGRLVTYFPEIKKPVSLKDLGDFLLYDAAETNHTTEFLEDTTCLTIRWPSKRLF